MRSPRVALAVLGIGLCLANLGFTLVRSTIPLELEGNIESIEFLSEDNPGIDEIYVLDIDGDEVHVDREVAKQLTTGVYVSKKTWSTELTVGRYGRARTIDLRPSEDFTGMAVTMPVVAIVLLIAMSTRARSPAAAGSGPLRPRA